jgi:hypothetical protein
MKPLTTPLAVLALLLSPASAPAQVEVLTPDMLARLDPAKEKPLQLAPTGDVARFVGGEGDWEEAAPPLILDLNRDGVQDFVVLSMLDAAGMRRAIIIHDWGDAPDVFGNAVFYLILDATGHVEEWAGTHRLTPRAVKRPGPAGPASGGPRP